MHLIAVRVSWQCQDCSRARARKFRTAPIEMLSTRVLLLALLAACASAFAPPLAAGRAVAPSRTSETAMIGKSFGKPKKVVGKVVPTKKSFWDSVRAAELTRHTHSHTVALTRYTHSHTTTVLSRRLRDERP